MFQHVELISFACIWERFHVQNNCESHWLSDSNCDKAVKVTFITLFTQLVQYNNSKLFQQLRLASFIWRNNFWCQQIVSLIDWFKVSQRSQTNIRLQYIRQEMTVVQLIIYLVKNSNPKMFQHVELVSFIWERFHVPNDCESHWLVQTMTRQSN